MAGPCVAAPGLFGDGREVFGYDVVAHEREKVYHRGVFGMNGTVELHPTRHSGFGVSQARQLVKGERGLTCRRSDGRGDLHPMPGDPDQFRRLVRVLP